MTRFQLESFFIKRGWKVENKNSTIDLQPVKFERTAKEIPHHISANSSFPTGISIHAHRGEYTLSIQGGLGKYSEPSVNAYKYKLVEIAVLKVGANPKELLWISLNTFENTESSEAIEGWVDFKRIKKITKRIETLVSTIKPIKRSPIWNLEK